MVKSRQLGKVLFLDRCTCVFDEVLNAKKTVKMVTYLGSIMNDELMGIKCSGNDKNKCKWWWKVDNKSTLEKNNPKNDAKQNKSKMTQQAKQRQQRQN